MQHLTNYETNYLVSITEDSGRAMPCKKFEDGTVFRKDNFAVLDDVLLSRLEDTKPGSGACWENLLAFGKESNKR